MVVHLSEIEKEVKKVMQVCCGLSMLRGDDAESV